MIAEAVDAALAVGWALLAWVVVLAAVGTVGLYAVVVTVWVVWRVVRGAWAVAGLRKPHTPTGGPGTPSRVSGDAGQAPAPADGHTGLSTAPAPPESHTAPPRTDSLPPLAAERPARDSSPATAPQRRSGPPLRPTPTWARKDAA